MSHAASMRLSDNVMTAVAEPIKLSAYPIMHRSTIIGNLEAAM